MKRFVFSSAERRKLVLICGLTLLSGMLMPSVASQVGAADAAYAGSTPPVGEDPERNSNYVLAESDVELLYAETPVTKFTVSNLSPQVESDMDYTEWFFSKWEDCRYIFLPATADRSKLTITCEAGGKTVYLNDKAIVSGRQTDLLATADTFTLKVGDKAYGEVKVMQSNLGCIYLTTAHGGLDYLDGHKSYAETGATLMVDAAGKVQYAGDLEKITSHGNSSWDYSREKHPYNIKLPEKSKLYGMGKAKKWALLGNYLDHSMMRNAVAFYMAEQAGVEYTMDYVFVDLYADGSYRGTYQLCERVQIQKHRVNITDLEEETEKLNNKKLSEYSHKSYGAGLNTYLENTYQYYDIPNNPEDITGGYLVEFQLYNRYANGYTKSGFVTSRGQACDVRSPEYASKAQIEYIRGFMQDLEDAIYSDTGYNGKGKHYSDYIDVDSLIRYYLVNEIMVDADSTAASFFFYKDSDSAGDGKLHCSPVWDFDLSCNNYGCARVNEEGVKVYASRADTLYTAMLAIHGYDNEIGDGSGSENPNTAGLSWIAKLYKREEFVKRISEIYFSEFDTVLTDLVNTSREGGAVITQMGEAIQPSAEMNNAAMHMYGGGEFRKLGPKNGDNFTECVEYVRNFLMRRQQALRMIWKEDLRTARAERVQAEYDALPLERYDETGRAALNTVLSEALSAIAEAEDGSGIEKAFAAAEKGFAGVLRQELSGDFNDDLKVDVLDAQGALMYFANGFCDIEDAITPTQFRNGDVDKNGVINAVDALHILKHAAGEMTGLSYPLPVTSDMEE